VPSEILYRILKGVPGVRHEIKEKDEDLRASIAYRTVTGASFLKG